MNNFQVSRGTWANMSIFQQLGNIGSEVGRTFNALRRNDTEMATQAAIRALDLFDATAEVMATKQKSSARLREVLRAREQFGEFYFNNEPDLGLEKYFTSFALAARSDA